jgi:hypothetical protein
VRRAARSLICLQVPIPLEVIFLEPAVVPVVGTLVEAPGPDREVKHAKQRAIEGDEQ